MVRAFKCSCFRFVQSCMVIDFATQAIILSYLPISNIISFRLFLNGKISMSIIN